MKTYICLIFFVLLLSIEVNAEKMPEQNSIQAESYSVKNFKDNEKEAKKWHKNEREKWVQQKRISREEQQQISKIKPPEQKQLSTYQHFLNDFLENKLNINDVNRKAGGRIDRIFDFEETSLLKNWVKEESDNYDNLFEEKGKELKEDIVVHSTINLSQYIDLDPVLGEAGFRDENDPAFLSEVTVQYLEADARWGKMMYYGVFDLTHVDLDQEGIVQLELTVPSGTKVLFNNANQILLPRNLGIQIYKKPTVINRYGKEFVSLEAKIVDIEEIEEDIKEQESIVEEQFSQSELLQSFMRESNRIQLDLTGELASIFIYEIGAALESVLNNFDEILLQKVIKYIDLSEGTITFTDTLIPFANGFQKGKPEDETKNRFEDLLKANGLTQNGVDVVTNIIICINKRRYNDSIEGLLTHELGHLVETLLIEQGHFDKTSGSEEFKQIFEVESTTLPDGSYGKTNTEEYWAETIREIYENNDANKERAKRKRPKTYKFITEQIAFIKEHL